jgi:hypothetical protein
MLAAGSGYHYDDATTGEELVEFHVDVLDDFQTRMNGMPFWWMSEHLQRPGQKAPD